MVDIARNTNGVNLPAEVTREILSSAQEASAVMRLAKQISLPGSGISIPVITGEATADWVNETDEKPVSRPALGNKNMTPHKLAVIVPFSNEFKRDLSTLYAEIVNRIPAALSAKFDAAVLRGEDVPTGNFDTLAGATAVSLTTDSYGALVAAHTAVATAGGVLNGWALAPQGYGALLGDVDTTGRPLYDLSSRTVLGAPVAMTNAVYAADADGAGAGTAALVGVAGDWTKAYWGTVEGVQISLSDQATLNDGGTQLNLWQRNMFAVRAEIEVGFVSHGDQYFARLTA